METLAGREVSYFSGGQRLWLLGHAGLMDVYCKDEQRFVQHAQGFVAEFMGVDE